MIQNIIKRITHNLIIINITIQQFRRQNLHSALNSLQQLTEGLLEIAQTFIKEPSLHVYSLDFENFTLLLSNVVNAQEKEDYVLVADLLELQILPWLQNVQEIMISDSPLALNTTQLQKNLGGIRKNDQDLAEKLDAILLPQEYIAEVTSSGLPTLQITDKTGTYYFHSNNNPALEGMLFAEQYYSINTDHYIILGLGLGYHIKAFLNLDDGITIDIIEPDINVIYSALYWMDLAWIYDNPRIHLIFDPNHTKLLQLLNTNHQLVIHYPSLRHISNSDVKLSLEKFFIHESGKRNLKYQFKNNYRDNIENCSRYIDELQNQFKDKNAIIVAAGPSLDKNISLLRAKPNNTIIVAVGTVFKKLISMSIIPDYVVFLDAQPRLYQQINELEDCKVPIICASTACKSIAKNYKGEKFLICQYGYDPAEKYAHSKGYNLYETGGSVTTIALDICIRLGCKEIAFIGLDLAYTNNKSHSCDTADYHLADTDNMISVPAVGGGTVLSSRLFIIYKEWIEKRISREKDKITVIDATEGGALKKGMTIMSLQDVINNWH